MRKLLFAVLAVGTLAAASTTPADASGGCGPYRHRTAWGYCRPPGQWGWPPAYGGYAFGGPRWGWHRPYYWGRPHYWHHPYYWHRRHNWY